MKWQVFVLFCFFPLYVWGSGSTSADIFRDIQESPIQGNVPETSSFDLFLKRDLTSFFQAKFQKSMEISYELLRQGPTQSGVALPKFYLWVRVGDKGTIIEEGALRVAAIEKTSFEVLQFISKAEIQTNSTCIDAVFPKALEEEIRRRAAR